MWPPSQKRNPAEGEQDQSVFRNSEQTEGFKSPEDPVKLDQLPQRKIELPPKEQLVLHSPAGEKEGEVPPVVETSLPETLTEEHPVHVQNLDTLLEHSGKEIETNTHDIYENLLAGAEEAAKNPEIH